VFVLCGLDCHEIPRFGGAGNFPHVWGVVIHCPSGSLVVLATEGGEVKG